MENPTVMHGDGGDHIAIVHLHDIGAGFFWAFGVECGEGYFDAEIDDFGETTLIILDEICVEYCERIHQILDGRQFYRGYEGVVEHNKARAHEVIAAVLEENPYNFD